MTYMGYSYVHFFAPPPLQDFGAADVEGLINAVNATGVTTANFPNVAKNFRRVCSSAWFVVELCFDITYLFESYMFSSC